jgi:hypothetical protein
MRAAGDSAARMNNPMLDRRHACDAWKWLAKGGQIGPSDPLFRSVRLRGEYDPLAAMLRGCNERR